MRCHFAVHFLVQEQAMSEEVIDHIPQQAFYQLTHIHTKLCLFSSFEGVLHSQCFNLDD